METVRLGMVGLGNMGTGHIRYIKEGKVANAVLAAVCDELPEKREWAKKEYGDRVAVFKSAEEMFASGSVDAVIIATPHYNHPEAAIQAFEHGLHVLIEK